MTNEQTKAIIEAMIERSGWTVGDNGECHPAK